MNFVLDPLQIPLRLEADGTLRMGLTRVTLDVVASSFEEGATPEAIVEQFPTLNLPDVYLVLGYVLKHPEELASYLEKRRVRADEFRRKAEARFNPKGLRDRLLARKNSITTG